MENTEALLMEFEEFNRGNEEDKQISQNLEQFIEYVAKTGKYIFPWYRIRKLYLSKLKCVLNNLTSLNTSGLNTSAYLDNSINEPNSGQSIKEIKDRIIERMESFNSAPFTIQRISELILKPNSHYTRIDKFLRGLEKCIMVVTTVDPNGNKIFIDNVYTNGVSDEGIKMGPLETPKKPNSILDETSVNVEVVESESLNITIEQSKLEFPCNPDHNLITTTVCVESSVVNKSDSDETTTSQMTDAGSTSTAEKAHTTEDTTEAENKDDQQLMDHECSQPEEDKTHQPANGDDSASAKESGVSVELNISSSSSLIENKIDDDDNDGCDNNKNINNNNNNNNSNHEENKTETVNRPSAEAPSAENVDEEARMDQAPALDDETKVTE